MRKIAAALVPPVGMTDVCAMIDDDRYYRAAWLVGGIRKVPFGPSFSRPRDVSRFVDIVKGGPA